jgi:hypothetical protein
MASTKIAKHIKRQQGLFPEMATKIDKKVALRQDILANPAQDVGSMGHIARLLAQFGLPHTDPGQGTNPYERTNGDLTFRITPQVADGGVPWGVLPRLLLAYVSSQAVYTKSRQINLGANLSSFLRDELGMSVTGGKNGTITRLKEQAYRLFTSSITIVRTRETTEGDIKGKRTMVGMMKIANTIDMWEPHKDKSPDELWQSAIELDEAFYKATIEAAVPIDWRIIGGIRNSPLALDLYFWLTYRMKTNRKMTPVPFYGENSIYEQLGCGYANTPSGRFAFKKQVGVQLAEIKYLWPGLNVKISDDGQFIGKGDCLVLFPSPTSISSLN